MLTVELAGNALRARLTRVDPSPAQSTIVRNIIYSVSRYSKKPDYKVKFVSLSRLGTCFILQIGSAAGYDGGQLLSSPCPEGGTFRYIQVLDIAA